MQELNDELTLFKEEILNNFSSFWFNYVDQVFMITEHIHAIYNWHIDYIGDQVYHLLKGDDLAIKAIWNLPPMSSKTSLGIALATLYTAFYPNTRMCIVSGNDKVQKKYAINIKEVISSPFYKELFPHVYINENKPNTIDLFYINENGCYDIYSIMAKNTGADADMAILDDIIDYNTYKREGYKYIDKVNNNAFYIRNTRLREFGTRKPMICIMQRICKDDTTDKLLSIFKSDNWSHICVPAIEDYDKDEYMGKKGRFYSFFNKKIFREKGTVLCSKVCTKERLMEKKLTFNSIVDFNYQYQQHNNEAETTLFSLGSIRRYSNASNLKVKILSADTANGLENGDYNAISLYGLDDDNNIYLLGLWINRFKLDILETLMSTIIDNEEPRYILIENASTGISLINSVEKKLYGMPLSNNDKRKDTRVIKVKQNTVDKSTRAVIANSLITRGLVYFPYSEDENFKSSYVLNDRMRKTTLEELEHELLVFTGENSTTERHDDAVDSFTQALCFIKKKYVDIHLNNKPRISRL